MLNALTTPSKMEGNDGFIFGNKHELTRVDAQKISLIQNIYRFDVPGYSGILPT